MTRDHYFEMCETLGSEPIDSEIPIELEDLPEVVQTAFSIYNMLHGEWEYMNGTYLGKNLQNIFKIFDLFQVDEEDRLLIYKVINIIDGEEKAIKNK